MIEFSSLTGYGCLEDSSGVLSGFQSKYSIGKKKCEKILAPISSIYKEKYDIAIMDELLWEYSIGIFREYIKNICSIQCGKFLMSHPKQISVKNISMYEEQCIILRQSGVKIIGPEIRKAEAEESHLYISVLDRISSYCDSVFINATDVETTRDIASISKTVYNVLIKHKKPIYVLYSSTSYESAKKLRESLAAYDTHWLLRGFGNDTDNDHSGLVDQHGNLKRRSLSRLSEAIR